MPSVVPTRRRLPVRRTGALAALVLLLTALGASPAAAHNTLRSTDPADGSTVATAPAQVTLTFDQPALELGTQILVTGPDGAVVSDGAVQLVESSVVQPLVTTLPAGTYTVDWRVTSADGHPLSGALTFTATEASGAAAPEPTEEPVPSDEPTAATPDVTTQATAEAAPTDEVVAVPADPQQDGETSPWLWVAVGGATLAALAAAVTTAVVAARRRGAEAADVAARTGRAAGPPADGSQDGPVTGA